MPEAARRREVGRGERVLPGVWRLRLPLPWPGVPHCNAWALAAGPGVVLVDTGMHEPGSLAHLERALDQVDLRLEVVRLVVCTHAHSDHCGQAAVIAERAGCEVWLHPNHEHMRRMLEDRDALLAQRLEVARQSGVPDEALRRFAEARRNQSPGVVAPLEPDRPLVEGVTVDSDLGEWRVVETPGHAPSHVCLYQPERRVLISGDHLLGRVSLYYDFGYTPDPAGEFLDSLAKVDSLGARLCLPGHGRPFTDVAAHVRANRETVQERLEAVRAAVAEGPKTPWEIVPEVHGQELTAATAGWWLPEILCYLRHLERDGAVERLDGETERWRAAGE